MIPVTKEDCEKYTSIMNDKIDKFKDNFVKFELSITKQIAELPKKVMDEAKCEFASKTTEKIVYALVGVICLAVVGSVVNNIIVSNRTAIGSDKISELIEEHLQDNYEITK